MALPEMAKLLYGRMDPGDRSITICDMLGLLFLCPEQWPRSLSQYELFSLQNQVQQPIPSSGFREMALALALARTPQLKSRKTLASLQNWLTRVTLGNPTSLLLLYTCGVTTRMLISSIYGLL